MSFFPFVKLETRRKKEKKLKFGGMDGWMGGGGYSCSMESNCLDVFSIEVHLPFRGGMDWIYIPGDVVLKKFKSLYTP